MSLFNQIRAAALRATFISAALFLTPVLFSCSSTKQVSQAPVRQFTDQPVKIGEVLVFEHRHRVEVQGQVCLREGILDFVAVGPNSGKEYESLLVLNCKPSHLHAAFLAIGARPGSIPEPFMGDARGAPEANDTRPEGHRFRIFVRPENGTWTPIENWLTDRSTGKSPESLEWIFTGSFFGRYPDGTEVYIADEESLIAAVWYRSACLLNVAAKVESPYRGATFGYEVNTRQAPPVGTPVTAAFQRVLSASNEAAVGKTLIADFSAESEKRHSFR